MQKVFNNWCGGDNVYKPIWSKAKLSGEDFLFLFSA
jgi:hypothetical protein